MTPPKPKASQTLKTTSDLEEFHQKILDLLPTYTSPEKLTRKLNPEYLGYVEARENNAYYAWLALAVRLLQPRTILELGNYYGVSSLMMYSEFGSGVQEFVSVDVKKDLRFLPDEVRDDPRSSFLFGNDLNLAIYETHLPVGIDFIFIDTLHELRHLLAEFYIYKHLLSSGALVILDDIFLGNILEFWARIPYPKLEISPTCHDSGFGMFLFQPEIDTEFLEIEGFDWNTIPASERIQGAYRAALRVAHREKFKPFSYCL